MSDKSPFKLNSFQINPLDNTLVSGDDIITLQPKFIEVLVFLAAKYPSVVTREEIIDAVWDGNSYVGEKALTNAIWHLRKSLKSAEQQEYIETIRKTGYRLLFEPSYRAVEPESSAKNWRQPHFWLAATGVLICVVLIFIWSRFTNDADFGFAQPELITQYPGRELFPALSHDERYLVFSWRNMDSQTDLFLHDLTEPSKSPKNLTQSAFLESRAIWSKDDQQLFYYRKGGEQGCEVIQHRLADDHTTPLAHCPNSSTGSLSLSANQSQLAYIGLTAKGNNAAVFTLDLTSGESQQLTCLTECDYRDEYMDFSPSGEQLVIVRNLAPGQDQLILHELHTGQEQVLLTWMHTIRGIAWHPSNEQLIFASHENGQRFGYQFDLETKQYQRLNVTGFSYPNISLQGDIYYHHWQMGTSIMRVDLAATINTAPFPLLQSEFNFRYPDYSSQANKLVVVSNESGNDELWLSSLDGTNRTQLTQLNKVVREPTWSHDGRFIAFIVKSLTENSLMVIDVATRQVTEINTGFVYHNKPSWSLDDQSLFVANDDNLFQIDLTTQTVTPLSEDGGRYGVMTTDGRFIYITAQRKGLKVRTENGQSSALFSEVTIPSSTGWQVTETGVYYFNVKGPDYRLSFFDFATGQHRDVLRVPERTFSRSRGMTYVPENSWLLFTGYETPQVDIKRIRKN
ncbi:winged helix-turn-helix domain-containing protein [Pseudoalteromonas ulvae]|uniref:OmpR/PhoB-type domain-containing protein n=1 Tax=Pseudoalteromonas ulvae TaxID=107327 RepID=A0A244CNP5_PSEDV|nr:winged helix-turn-helix domain-containing protein [Pseudoalteromonas ulvae]OUL57188.1 hypothetical protein B1199_13510 [Pseudoalteromonas ulvae]